MKWTPGYVHGGLQIKVGDMEVFTYQPQATAFGMVLMVIHICYGSNPKPFSAKKLRSIR